MGTDNRAALLVEGNRVDRRQLEQTLRAMGLDVTSTAHGRRALAQLRTHPFDVIVVATDLEGTVDGVRIAKAGQWRWPEAVMILTTRKRSLQTAITAIELGVDGYLLKPIEDDRLRETVRQARERHTECRSEPEEKGHLQWNGLSLDTEGHRAVIKGRSVQLTPSESKILGHLMRNSHRVVTKEELNEVIYPDLAAEKDNDGYEMLRWHVYNLRKKIEPDSSHPQYILTEYGIGYRLSTSDASVMDGSSRSRP
jgi:DNA-binding response OmpR family regulator